MDWPIWTYFIATGILWCGFYIRTMLMTRYLPELPAIQISSAQPFPKLSVIVTAKDEAHTIEQAMQSLLNTDYPDFEIIVVNDRSSDHTGEIIDRFAQNHPHIKPIHIKHLPDEWLGKVHALHSATAQASGEWLLFTDADVHHHPKLWRQAIHHATKNQYQHLALLPNVPTRGLLLQGCIKAFGMLFLSTARVEKIEDPDSKASIGIGAFNLVRHSAFNETPGFEWLRMEVADDYGVGIMMKQHGFRCSFATAYDLLQVDWYPDVRSMIKGLEKNIMAPGTHFKTWRLVTRPLMFAAVILGPLLSLLVWTSAYPLVGLTVFLFIVMASIRISDLRHEQLSKWLMTPAGFLIILYAFGRACLLCLIRDGIIWRNTFYPRALLRQYQRVKL